jgi:hypothetical protein
MGQGDDGGGTDAGDAERGRHRARFDLGNESASLALIEAIAAAKDVDPFTLDPLGCAVDMDALDEIVTSTGPESTVQVTVVSQGVRATVDDEGGVVVQVAGSGTLDGARGE